MIRILTALACAFLSLSTASAQQKTVFTVARREATSITSVDFDCVMNADAMDCAFGKTRISQKASIQEENNIRSLTSDQLMDTFPKYTAAGSMCTENLSDEAITERILGGWGKFPDKSLLTNHASAWREMCRQRNADTIRAYLEARFEIDRVSCVVSNIVERAVFKFNNGRWLNIDSNAGVLCPGSVIMEVLEQHKLAWTYEYVENINPQGGGLCANVKSVDEKYDFVSWAAPAPFTCQTIEFSTF